MQTDDAMDDDISRLLIAKKAGYGLAPGKWRASLELIRDLPEFDPDEEHPMSHETHDQNASMAWLRYGVPAAIFLLGCVLLIIDDGGTIGLEGFLMGVGAALAVVLLNWLFRLGAEGDRERQAEEAARDYYSRTGHWPDEDPR